MWRGARPLTAAKEELCALVEYQFAAFVKENQFGGAAKYFLEGTVSDLYADVRDPEKPRAVVELHAYLTTSSAESPSRILFNRNYREVQVMTGPGPAEFVKSAGVALTNILEALEDDLLKLAREMDREQETRS